MDGLSAADGREHPSRSARPEPGRRQQRHARHDQPEQGNLAEERAQPDPRAAAFELRDQGRSAEDHQRAASRRRDLSSDVQRGRPGDSDSEFRAEQQHRPARADQRRPRGDGLRQQRVRRRPDRAGQRSRQEPDQNARPATTTCWHNNSTASLGTGSCRRRRCRSAPGRAAWAAARTPTSIRSST